MIWAAAVVMLVTCLASPPHLSAQAVWVQGGTSTLMSTSGAQLDYSWAPVRGWVGIGFGNGALVGGYMETQVRHFDLGFGDRYQPLSLPSDVFDSGRYFSGRGLFVTRRGEEQTWTAFAGFTADERSYSFFRAFDIQQSTAAFFYSRKIGKATFTSNNIAQDKATSIQSVQLTLSPNLTVSTSAGVGYNNPFFSTGAKYQGRNFEAIAGYSFMGDSFRRIGGVTTNAPEHVGGNVRFRYQPSRNLGVLVSHESFFSPTLKKSEQPLNVSMNTGSVFGSLKGFGLSASASNSSAGEITTRTQSFSTSREITQSISASGTVMRLGLTTGTSNVYIGTVREKITPRLSLNQGISRQGNNNSLTFGGRFLSNRLTLGVQHDMVYSTIAGSFGGRTAIRMWTVNLDAHLFGGISLHTNSMVDATGHVRYTAWFDGLGFGNAEDRAIARPTQPSASFSKYVVRGIVRDTEGNPVWGINVQVDGQNAFSDSAGRFFLRFRRGDRYPVAVVPERSLNMDSYIVVECPVSAQAESEGVATPIVITLRKIKAPRPRRRSEIDTTHDAVVGGGGLAPEPQGDDSAAPDAGLSPQSSLIPPVGIAPESGLHQ